MKIYFILVLALTFCLLIHSLWVNFCKWSEVRVQFHSSGCSYPDVPVPFDEEVILSWLKCFGCLFENQLATEVCVYLWTLNSILLIYMSILVLVPHCLDYHCFVVNFELGMCISYLVLFKRLFWIFYIPCNSMWIL